MIQKLKHLARAADAKLSQPGYWLELLCASLLVITYVTQDDAALGQFPRTVAALSFTLLWTGVVLSFVVTVIGGTLVVISQTATADTALKPNTVFDWALDFTCWALIAIIGWHYTAIAFLVTIIARHLIATTEQMQVRRAQSIAASRPQVSPDLRGITLTHPTALPVQFELHANGVLVPPTDYILSDVGLLLRYKDLALAELHIKVYQALTAAAGGETGTGRAVLFDIVTIGTHWPGVFKDTAPDAAFFDDETGDANVEWLTELPEQ